VNPETAHIVEDKPELRIIPPDLWQRVKDRQQITRRQRPEKARRPKHLLSGLLTCGACEGGCSMISTAHYGCTRNRKVGICKNNLTIRRDVVEQRIIDGLRHNMMRPEAVKAFIAEFIREANHRAANASSHRHLLEAEFIDCEQKQQRLMAAIIEGTPPRLVNAQLIALETRRAEIETALKAEPTPVVRLAPNLSELYSREIEDLGRALRVPETAQQAGLAIRGLIDRIRLVPEDGKLAIHLEGARAALLALGQPESKRGQFIACE